MRWLVAYVAAIGLMVTVFYLRPAYNWDMLPYVAIARQYESADFVQLHRDLYADLAAVVPADDFASLTGNGSTPEPRNGNTFRAEMARDAGAFHEQLPFYSVKPVYPVLIALVERLGIDPFHASVAVTLAAFVALCTLIWHWFRKHHSPKFATAFALLVAVAPPLALLARESTPDLLSVCVIVLSTYLLLEHRATAWTIALMLLAILVRPNNAIWSVVMAGYLAIWAPPPIRINRWAAVGVAGIAVAIYVAITQMAGFYAFSTLFYVSTIEVVSRPATFVSSLGPLDYAREYIRYLPFASLDVARDIAALFAIFAMLVLSRLPQARTNELSNIALVCLATAIPLWLVDPPAFNRLAAAQYVLVMALAIIAMGTRSLGTPRGQGPRMDSTADQRFTNGAPV